MIAFAQTSGIMSTLAVSHNLNTWQIRLPNWQYVLLDIGKIQTAINNSGDFLWNLEFPKGSNITNISDAEGGQ